MSKIKNYYWDEICMYQEEDNVMYDLYWYADELDNYMQYDEIQEYNEAEGEDD